MALQDRPEFRCPEPRRRPSHRLVSVGLVSVMSAAAAGSALADGPVVADGPPGLEQAFDNTIVSTYANGDRARLWINRDGGYRGEGRRGDASSGRWYVKGGKLCLKQSRPLPIPLAFCSALITGGVGTVWTAKSVFGEPLTLQLAAGR